jgi:hypothetical protein
MNYTAHVSETFAVSILLPMSTQRLWRSHIDSTKDRARIPETTQSRLSWYSQTKMGSKLTRKSFLKFTSVLNSALHFRKLRLGFWIWGYHSDGCEEIYLLGYTTVQSDVFQTLFRRNISSPSSVSKSNRSTKPAEANGKLSLNSYGLMWLRSRFITSWQCLSLFCFLVLTVALEVTATHFGVFCEVLSNYFKLGIAHSPLVEEEAPILNTYVSRR